MRSTCFGALFVGAAALAPAHFGHASSHREAPFITTMPKVDGTDFYMFRSYETGRGAYVTLIANYVPLQHPYGGPNYFTMDPDAIYEIHIDNNGDAQEDLTFQFDFDTALAASGSGFALDVGPSGNTKSVAIPLVVQGPIGAANDPDQNVLETYTIKLVTGDRRTGNVAEITNETDGGAVFAKPLDYIGEKTFASYATYANGFIKEIDIPGCSEPAGVGARVFVGQRAEGFAVNLGEIFDLVNANEVGGSGFNILGAPNQGENIVGSSNVTTIAIEVPAACLNDTADSVIGGWTTASVRQARVINPAASYETPQRVGGPWVQVSRLGSPLVNEVVIGIKDKDRFNGAEPNGDTQFLDYVTNPTFPELVELLFSAAGVEAPDLFPRTDLIEAFLTGLPNVNQTTAPSEMLRLNTGIPATPEAGQSPLGAARCIDRTANGYTLDLGNAGCDPAGFPNGRRPGDDVTDIIVRVAMGYLAGTSNAPSGGLAFVDGAFLAPTSFRNTFPYLNTPRAGSPQ